MDFVNKLNHYGKTNTPCFFLIDFDKNISHVEPLETLENVHLKIDNYRNYTPQKVYFDKEIIAHKNFISYANYKKGFDKIKEQIKKGNTYLFNLTYPTDITLNYSLDAIFRGSDAKFKILFKDTFLSFSPERFIKITNNTIQTHPMKGTIDASIKDAEQIILSNEKEMAEHTMVVDLLRNDLSQIATHVRVKKFRYVEKIQAGKKDLLQVSSHIEGKLEENWESNMGNILDTLLPAGSITGAPKKMTTELIHSIEEEPRGFYTGIFGVYQNGTLDSGVLIRFIEKTKKGYVYKSGGGITWDSDPESEYQELKDKVYVPIF